MQLKSFFGVKLIEQASIIWTVSKIKGKAIKIRLYNDGFFKAASAKYFSALFRQNKIPTTIPAIAAIRTGIKKEVYWEDFIANLIKDTEIKNKKTTPKPRFTDFDTNWINFINFYIPLLCNMCTTSYRTHALLIIPHKNIFVNFIFNISKNILTSYFYFIKYKENYSLLNKNDV